MVYIKLLSRLGLYYIPLHSYQYYGRILANIILYNKFSYFFNTKVIYYYIINMVIDKFYSNDFCNEKKILIVENIFNILPVFN